MRFERAWRIWKEAAGGRAKEQACVLPEAGTNVPRNNTGKRAPPRVVFVVPLLTHSVTPTSESLHGSKRPVKQRQSGVGLVDNPHPAREQREDGIHE